MDIYIHTYIFIYMSCNTASRGYTMGKAKPAVIARALASSATPPAGRASYVGPFQAAASHSAIWAAACSFRHHVKPFHVRSVI